MTIQEPVEEPTAVVEPRPDETVLHSADVVEGVHLEGPQTPGGKPL